MVENAVAAGRTRLHSRDNAIAKSGIPDSELRTQNPGRIGARCQGSAVLRESVEAAVGEGGSLLPHS